jgi:hypothetical protein
MVWRKSSRDSLSGLSVIEEVGRGRFEGRR